MKYLKLFFLFVIFQGYSQTTSVEYECHTNFGIPINSIWVLTFNKNESFFYESDKKTRITEDSFKEQGEFFKNFDVKKENIKYVDSWIQVINATRLLNNNLSITKIGFS